MSDRARGIYDKYLISRIDGSDRPGGKHHDCPYFVLDLDHDPYAIPALQAYAEACASRYPLLSRDLKEIIRAMKAKP